MSGCNESALTDITITKPGESGCRSAAVLLWTDRQTGGDRQTETLRTDRWRQTDTQTGEQSASTDS